LLFGTGGPSPCAIRVGTKTVNSDDPAFQSARRAAYTGNGTHILELGIVLMTENLECPGTRSAAASTNFDNEWVEQCSWEYDEQDDAGRPAPSMS
jgi:hypothetical protein